MRKLLIIGILVVSFTFLFAGNDKFWDDATLTPKTTSEKTYILKLYRPEKKVYDNVNLKYFNLETVVVFINSSGKKVIVSKDWLATEK